jgi:hypothetical protein
MDFFSLMHLNEKPMKELLDKISSYNIFNHLVPGVLFVFLLKETTDFNLVLENNIIGVFLYYFIGMILSRFGSLVLDPALKKISFVKFSNYKSFVDASKKDAKIDVLSEVNNSYRTIAAMLLLLLFAKGVSCLRNQFQFSYSFLIILIILACLLLFLFSYRKQTNYISKRIEANQK